MFLLHSSNSIVYSRFVPHNRNLFYINWPVHPIESCVIRDEESHANDVNSKI